MTAAEVGLASGRAWILCQGCGAAREMKARNLCNACYVRHRTAGTLHYYPRSAISSAELVEDYHFLARVEGLTRRQAAERMGITKKRLEKAIERTQRRAS